MAASEKLLAVHFIAPQSVGLRYEGHTPQHITVMPWFRAEPDAAADILDTVAAEKPFSRIRLGEAAMFGPNNDVPVYRIVPKSVVAGIHHAILRRLRTPGTYFEPLQTEYISGGFNPHLSIYDGQPHRRSGEVLVVDNIGLVSRNDSDQKEILHIVELRG